MLNTAVGHTIHPSITLDTAANAWQALKDLYDRKTSKTKISLLYFPSLPSKHLCSR